MANIENDKPLEEEGDPYVILNLSRDCTDEEIQRSFKQLSRTFHPDKHPPTTRQQAQDVFVAFKNAHDILIDPVLRQIFDAFGHRGIRVIKLSLHSSNADALYPTLLQYHQAGTPDLALNFAKESLQCLDLERNDDAVHISAVMEYPCALDSLDTFPELSSAKLQVAVTSESSSPFSVTMGGSTTIRDGKGDGSGNMSIGYKPVQGTDMTLDVDIATPYGLALGSTRVFTDRTVLTTTMRTQPNSNHLSLSIATHRSLWENQCRGMWALGMGTNGQLQYCMASLTTLYDDYPQCTAKVNLGVSSHPLELSTKYSMPEEKDQQLSASCAFGGATSVEWKVTMSRPLTNYCKLRVGVKHTASAGLSLLFDLERGNVKFRVPIVISKGLLQQDWTRWMLFLTIPFAIDELIGDLVKQASSKSMSTMIKNSQRLPVHFKTKEEAEVQIRMMKKAAEARKAEEQDVDGLVIAGASYFVKGGDRWDVTIPLQFWVRNSQLELSSAPKSELLGFYNLVPTPFQARLPWWKAFSRAKSPEVALVIPRLLVRYSYHGNVYELTIQDTEALILPCEHALEPGNNSRILS